MADMYGTNIDHRGNVAELQRALRRIAFDDNDIPMVAADGFYGERTQEAVRVFQRQNLLPVTGAVDSRTWEAIFAEHRRIVLRFAPGEEIKGFPEPLAVLRLGSLGAPVYFLQVMLHELSNEFDNFTDVSINGTFDSATAAAVGVVNGSAGMDYEYVDKASWNMITKLFNDAVSHRS